MKLLKFTLISILGLSLCTACGGDGDGGETPGPGKPEGPDKSSTTGIDRFDASNIFSRNTYLPDNTAMQGFNLDSDGSVWYTQLSNTNQAQLNWVRAQPNKTPDVQTENKDYMKLTYFGHGTNTALEEDGADRYLWAGAYGVCNAKGQYWNEKLVGRVKYVKGATVKTNECNDYYYIGDYTDLHPSIDAKNDLLTINYGDSKNSSYRCFVIYKLSEAKKAPMTNVTITCTDGFQTDRPASTNPVSVVVRCHDLTTLTPVARPRFLKTGYGASGATYYDWQGYDVHKNRLYYTEGQSNYNLFGSFYSGSSFAYVTVFDFEGNIVEERTQVAVGRSKPRASRSARTSSIWDTRPAESPPTIRNTTRTSSYSTPLRNNAPHGNPFPKNRCCALSLATAAAAEGFARGPVTPNDFGCTRSPTHAAPDRSRRPATPTCGVIAPRDLRRPSASRSPTRSAAPPRRR